MCGVANELLPVFTNGERHLLLLNPKKTYRIIIFFVFDLRFPILLRYR